MSSAKQPSHIRKQESSLLGENSGWKMGLFVFVLATVRHAVPGGIRMAWQASSLANTAHPGCHRMVLLTRWHSSAADGPLTFVQGSHERRQQDAKWQLASVAVSFPQGFEATQAAKRSILGTQVCWCASSHKELHFLCQEHSSESFFLDNNQSEPPSQVTFYNDFCYSISYSQLQ